MQYKIKGKYKHLETISTFSHSIKMVWLSSVPTGVTICWDLVNDDERPFKKYGKNGVKWKRWSRHHSLLLKTMKSQEKRKMNDLRTRDELGSQLRMEKVLAPHSACPKIVYLIEW